MSQNHEVLLGGDRGVSFPPLPLKVGEDFGTRVKKFRDHLLRQSMTEVFPSARSFVDHIRRANPEPDAVRMMFVQSTFMLEKSMECFRASGILATGTLNAAQTMFQEMRYEVQRSLRMLGHGVAAVSDPEVVKALDGAEERMTWLHKLAEQTLGIKRPDISRELKASRPGMRLELN